ncbi:MAG: bifunctional transaldolase/phosoglucose isomerase, partial [Myxococcales bacterium]
GVQQFSSAFDKLMASIEHKRQRGLKSTRERLAHRLPRELADKVIATLADWRAGGKVRRLWARDASLWTGHDEGQWLDWLNIADDEQKVEPELLAFAAEARHAFTHAVVLGMGGSSLCPDVLAATLGPIEGYPTLLILDSTDPAQITALETRISLDKTLFIVSSKSGTTLEPNILAAHFYDRVREAVGDAHAGEHFVAVTDPGSPLQALAESLKFSRVFLGAPGIGGRYSALSDFGMLPAAVMGVDVPAFLGRVQYMVHACAPCVPPEANPGVLLGASAQSGRNKITLIASPKMVQAGAWIEQLLAESTGKEGRGLVPVDREPLGPPAVYDSDRLFVYLRLDEAPDVAQDDAVNALEKAGHPVVRIAVADPYDLGQEFFRSEIATAVAGAILGIDPFNQPDVEASKIAARTLTDAYESTGALPDERSFHREGSLQLFADERNHVALERATHSDKTLVGYLKAHLSRTQSGDYFAILAFIERNDVHERRLQKLRSAILGSRRVATCLGFGPRFLHSTGQAYKGGPNTGVFLQLTCDDPQDVKVPNRRVTFGIAKAAQARGDFQVLAERNRRALRVHLGRHVDASLETLCEAIERTVA